VGTGVSGRVSAGGGSTDGPERDSRGAKASTRVSLVGIEGSGSTGAF
jgi:hypothetical protein